MTWKGWIVLIIIALVLVSHPQLITQIINALTTFINAVTQGLGNVNVPSNGG